MEKIKKALEKARGERNGDETPSAQQAVRSGDEPIAYTHTKTISGSVELMRENRLVNLMERGVYTESLKILSTQMLQRMQENSWNSIAITSPRKSAGTTSIAINLGISIAMEVGYTVLVVDANLRNPSVHEYFGIRSEFGLADYLTGEYLLEDLLINPKDIDRFVMLPAGRPSVSSAELLGSPKMASLVKELSSRYPNRFIIFDTPSVLDSSDLLNFSPAVDSVLMVVEDDETKESDLLAAVDMLTATNIIGTVVNKAKYI